MSDAGEFRRNVEIKVKLEDEKEFNEKVAIAQQLTGQSKAEIIVQHDVFFEVPKGRLKLRYEGDCAKLIQYSRDDVAGPKLSKFNILEVADGKLLERMLSESCGILGVLDKTRHLFIYEGRTRIHLDVVKNRGSDYHAMEFEVVMKPDEDLELGNSIADRLIKSFTIKKSQLLEGSYFEILNAKSD